MIKLFLLIAFLYSKESYLLLDKIVALVGNKIITLSDLEKHKNNLKFSSISEQELNEILKDNKKILDNIIKEELIKQYLAEKDMLPTEQEINSSIDRIIKQHGLKEQQFLNKLKAEGISEELFREAREKDLIFKRFFEIELRNNINITELDLENVYKKLFNKEAKIARYHIKHIFTRSSKLADEIIKNINKFNFEDYVLKHTEDESTKFSGGDLGFLDKSDLVEEIQNALKNMSILDIKGPIKTKIGYQIIKLENIKFTYSNDFKDKEQNLRIYLVEEASQKLLNQWAEARKELYYVKILL